VAGFSIPDSVDVFSTSGSTVRNSVVRNLNTYDDVLHIHSAYSDADMVASSAAASTSLDMRGYESVSLFIDFTVGSLTGASGFDLKVEGSYSKNGPWFEPHFHVTNNSNWAKADSAGKIDLDTSNHIYAWRNAADSKILITLKKQGNFMRVTPTAVVGGGSVSGSRITIDAIRVMEST